MKTKFIYIFLLSTLILNILLDSNNIVYAKQKNTSEVNVVMNEQLQVYEQTAVSIDGTALVPMRAIFESLGASVSYTSSSKPIIASKDGITIQLTLNSKTAYVGGNKVTLGVAPTTIKGHTMIPLRFVSEALGATVDYNASTKTVTITSPKDNKNPAPVETVAGIKTLYGTHTYGSANQKEYDYVMDIVKTDFKNKDSHVWLDDADRHQMLYEVIFNGKTQDDYTNRKDRNNVFIVAQEIEQVASIGLTKQELYDLVIVKDMAGKRLGNPDQSKVQYLNKSAYQAITQNLADCVGISQIYMAYFDYAGFNTAMAANYSAKHAEPIVQIKGEWYGVTGSQFIKATTNGKLPSKVSIGTSPTISGTLK